MQPIYIDFLNGLDIDELGLSNDEILSAIEASLGIQGRGEAVIEPRTHLIPGGSSSLISLKRPSSGVGDQ